jgi:phosphoglycerate dehydrogenase-like enzyme
MNILVAAPDPESRKFIFHKEGIRRLSALGNVSWLDEAQSLAEAVRSIDIVLTTWRSPRFDKAVIEQADRLKLLAHCAGTVVPYVVPKIFSRGIRVVNANNALAHCTAELVMAHIVSGVWRIKEYDRILQKGGWSNPREKMPFGLQGSIVGIVGMGIISRFVMEMMRPFNCKFLLYSSYLKEDDAKKLGAELVSLDELCRRSDIVSLHNTLTEKTRGMFGSRQFSLMKDGALFVNTARGPIVDNKALLDAARESRIYISLDVYEKEPASEDSIALARYDKVCCTPHIGGHCIRYHDRMFGDMVDEIERFIKGDDLLYEVSYEVYQRQSPY